MGLCDTYGTLCELIAAAQVFPFVFEVWNAGTLYYTTAVHNRADVPTKRLRFTGNFSGGHFDVLEDAETKKESAIEDDVFRPHHGKNIRQQGDRRCKRIYENRARRSARRMSRSVAEKNK
ncbi:hypothetical protein CEXT_785551 [Caerostris extrusa]|uniref:Ubiquitinyl hydrolase 1 n=1 Tax=Caerostris extrusa TaxID=172846 RepID=A0AAV4MLV7_CAEEX|nr:hypothetical protein CEXT_785551 [Caerostris extrusa]